MVSVTYMANFGMLPKWKKYNNISRNDVFRIDKHGKIAINKDSELAPFLYEAFNILSRATEYELSLFRESQKKRYPKIRTFQDLVEQYKNMELVDISLSLSMLLVPFEFERRKVKGKK